MWRDEAAQAPARSPAPVIAPLGSGSRRTPTRVEAAASLRLADRALLAQPRHAVASISPSLARALLALVEARGQSAQRLCRGLGFSYADLRNPELRLSYLQTRRLILRAMDLFGEPALGLATGARQTPLSLGLAGLAMLTCETFGEAVAYGIGHQNDAGAMLDFVFEESGREMSFEVTPRVFDARIEPFLVEEALGTVMSVARHLVGHELVPLRVEFAFRDSGAKRPCAVFFRCPVRYGAGSNRLVLESRWLTQRLPGYDPITSRVVREQLDTLLTPPAGRQDLVETLARRFRSSTDEPPRQAELARQANLSERTLRRRLNAQALSYRGLRDDALYEKARDLLGNSNLKIHEVASAVGYADTRAFRRAFKRWSGRLPTEFRRAG